MEVQDGSIEERIINASFNILEKEGISGTTTKKIAEVAEVSEVTLFRKFETKQKLIEASKEYYSERLVEKLENIFEFSENQKIEDYLKTAFNQVINLTDSELKIIKVGMEEVRNIPSENKVFLKVANTVMYKLTCFFKLKINQGEIRDINPEMLSLNIFSIMFESVILWKIYGKSPQHNVNDYINDFLDIILNGIK